jgi:hypothetical protein
VRYKQTPEEIRESLLKRLEVASEIVKSWDDDKQKACRKAIEVHPTNWDDHYEFLTVTEKKEI